MKNVMIYFLVASSFLFLFSSCNEDQLESQDGQEILDGNITNEHVHEDGRKCGHNHHMDKLLSNPEYKKAYLERMEKFKVYNAEHLETRAACNNPTKVPVAIHYQSVNNPNSSCLETMAVEAIAALNKDIQGTNSDISDWTGNASSSFPGISNGEACLEFVIANQNHPAGFGLTNGDLAVTINQTNNDSDSRWSGYLNIFIIPNTGYLGYSPLGGSGNGDGVVIDAGAWGVSGTCSGVGASAPYNLGRTLTHELGHYLLLDHIWGGGCGQDDGVADTPEQASDYGGCPSIGSSSCGSTDLHMNYMDYTNDACMYMFTAGQATVIENYVSSNLSSITGNAGNVISGGGSGGGTTCDAPTSVQVGNITETTAVVSFSAANANSVQVQFRVSGTSSWTTETTTTSSKSLTGLTAETTYQVRLRSLCSSSVSSLTSVITFTTAQANGGGTDDDDDDDSADDCRTPSFSSTELISDTRTKVTWEEVADVDRYQIRYRIQGTSRWYGSSTRNTYKTLKNLQYGETYEYRLRTRCATGWTPLSAVKTFVQGEPQDDDTDDDAGCNTVNLFIQFDDYASDITFELYNDETGVREASGGPYNDGKNKLDKDFCIADGCYTLYVDDAYGDGLCCDYGDGYFEIRDQYGDVVAYSDGNFGSYDYLEFCVEDNIVEFKNRKNDVQAKSLKKRVASKN